jgi:hypothetical protein
MEDNIDDNKYLLKMTDCDGDEITVASPWHNDTDLMLRITNDEFTNGIIVNLPIAMGLMSVLLPFIQTAKLGEAIDSMMNPEKDL